MEMKEEEGREKVGWKGAKEERKEERERWQEEEGGGEEMRRTEKN